MSTTLASRAEARTRSPAPPEAVPPARRAAEARMGPLLAAAALLAGLSLGVSRARAQDAGSAELLDVDSAEVAARLAGGSEWKTDFSRIAVPPREIVSGGPPKDGIPSLDDPRFVSAGEASGWLEPSELVIVYEHGGVAKAYPLRILVWHEIANDRVGGKPVAVTYCPLCNTALVFDRKVDGRVLDFGTTGRLRHSDLVMYDRQTGTWWQQASGKAIVGDLVRTTLEFLPANTYSWSRARELHPNLRVLSKETGYGRDYGRNPYSGYDDPDGSPIGRFLTRDTDPRLPPMERVVAVRVGEGWAVPYRRLRDVRVVNATVAGRPLAVFWAPGGASALDAGRVAGGRDVGQTAAFDRRVSGRTLTFRWKDGQFVDEETGTAWNLAGEGVSGPLAGEKLTPVVHDSPFWFAWVGFMPETGVWKGGGR